MKKTSFCISLLFLIASYCMAQDVPLQTEVLADSARDSGKSENRDQYIIDFTYDSWQKVPPDITTSFLSRGVSLAFMHDIIFGNSPVGFAFGVGFSSHNVFSNGGFEEKAATDSTLAYTRFVPLTSDYIKNKLSVNYLEIPFEIRFRTKGENPFRIYMGFKGGFLINIHTKIIDDKGKRKFYTFDNANSYRYGITSRIGYGNFSLTGFYGLSTLFKEGQGDVLIPYSIGVSVLY